MPKVKVTDRCIVKAASNVNVTYDVVDEVLAPDAHIEEIVRQGKGERLTSRGDAFKPAEPAARQ